MSLKLGKEIYIVAAKRTAFGTFGGELSHLTAPQIGSIAGKAVVDELPSPDIVDSVVFGNVAHSTTDCSYLARHIGVNSGVPIEKPALTINRLCSSGAQAIANAAQEIELGMSNVVLAGGAESMSQSPYTLHGTRWGTRLGMNNTLVDSLWEGLTDKNCGEKGTPMSQTAQNLADEYGVTRQQADEYALRSQQNWKKANDAGKFKDEIVPIELKDRKKGVYSFDTDSNPRPNTTMESLGKLRALAGPEGVVTGGNASGIGDGAGAVVVASAEAVKEHNLTPLCRIVAFNAAGVRPEIMGIGPAYSIPMVLDVAGLKIDDIDMIEINEAFAAQIVAVTKHLDIDYSKLNLNGGGISLAHPTGASGARIAAHIAHQQANDKSIKYAINSMCIGGGQGFAMITESV